MWTNPAFRRGRSTLPRPLWNSTDHARIIQDGKLQTQAAVSQIRGPLPRTKPYYPEQDIVRQVQADVTAGAVTRSEYTNNWTKPRVSYSNHGRTRTQGIYSKTYSGDLEHETDSMFRGAGQIYSPWTGFYGGYGRYKAYRGRQRNQYRSRGYRRRRGGTMKELHFLDTATGANAISATGEICPASGSTLLIVEGTGEDERIGRHILLKQVTATFAMKLPTATAAADGGDQLRILIYVDKQCNGVIATKTDIIIGNPGIDDFRNLFQSRRFHLLADKTFNFNPSISGNGTAIDTMEVVKNWTFSKKMNLQIDYDNAAAAITSLTGANVNALLISRNGKVEAACSFRVRYVDL